VVAPAALPAQSVAGSWRGPGERGAGRAVAGVDTGEHSKAGPESAGVWDSMLPTVPRAPHWSEPGERVRDREGRAGAAGRVRALLLRFGQQETESIGISRIWPKGFRFVQIRSAVSA
jgi:hypothetical protein